jgi:hypothetical protein
MGLSRSGGSLGAALALVLFAACAGTDTPPHAGIQDELETAYGNGASAAGSAGSASMSAAGAAGSSPAGSAGAAGVATGAGGSGSGAAGSGSMVGTAGSASVGTAGSGAVGSAGAGSGGAGATGGGAALSFATDIYPIFTANCVPCHSTDGDGGQNIASPDKAQALSDTKSHYTQIISDVASGSMPLGTCSGPPDSPGCLTSADFEKIQAWSKAGSPE